MERIYQKESKFRQDSQRVDLEQGHTGSEHQGLRHPAVPVAYSNAQSTVPSVHFGTLQKKETEQKQEQVDSPYLCHVPRQFAAVPPVQLQKTPIVVEAAVDAEAKTRIFNKKYAWADISIFLGAFGIGKITAGDADSKIELGYKTEATQKTKGSTNEKKHSSVKKVDFGALSIFDGIGFNTQLSGEEFAVEAFAKSKDSDLEFQLKQTIIRINIEKGSFEALKGSGTLKVFRDLKAGEFEIKGGSLLKVEVEPDRAAILKYIGKKIAREVVEEAAEKALLREAEKQGVKLTGKKALQQVLTKINPALVLLSAFDTGWTIGTLLRKYTVAGEIADKEMESLSGFKEKYQDAGTLGKVGWSIIYAPKIGWTMVKAGVKGVAGAAGKAVGDYVNEDDNAMAFTDGDILEKYGFDIELEEKIKYFKDIGGGYTSESEEERLVKIFEYSSSSDRKLLMSNKDVWWVFVHKIDGADRKRFVDLLDEARGKKQLRISESVMKQDNLRSWIKQLKGKQEENPEEFQKFEHYIDDFLKDLDAEIQDASFFELPLLMNFRGQFASLKSTAVARKKIDLVPPYVADILKTKERLDWRLRSRINPLEVPDYASSEAVIESMLLEYSKLAVQGAESTNDNDELLSSLETELIHEVEHQIEFLEKYLDHYNIEYTYK